VVAVRVRASVGRPGGSALAQWRQLRAAEWTAWTRTLPRRVAATLGIGISGIVLGCLVVPRFGLVVGVLAAVAGGWRLRFRPSPDAVAWRRGAVGERRTARFLGPLERHGWVVLHDLAVHGSRASSTTWPSARAACWPSTPNSTGAGYEWTTMMGWSGTAATCLSRPCARPYGGRPGRRGPRHRRHPGRRHRRRPRHQNLLGRTAGDGVTVVAARRLPDLLQALPPILGPERVAWLADRARLRFRSAA